MNKKMKEFMSVTCLSFTLVSVINAVLGLFSLTTILTSFDILISFITCVIIAFLITIGDFIPIVKDYLYIYDYIVVIGIASGLNTVILGHFYWENMIVQIGILTLVYLAVGFAVYGLHCKQATLINQKIDQSHKRNLK